MQAFAGNPAAVCLVPPSVELSETTMKRIAREMNLSETAFVQPFPGVCSPPRPAINKLIKKIT
jgi:predicted PhzF superfamily epimerase YddE/YHI9